MSLDLNKPKQVFYIGKKPIKHDTVAGTGLIWSGYGDSHMVPHSPAILLLQHTEVWCGEERFKLLNPELVNQDPSGLGLANVPPAALAEKMADMSPEQIDRIFPKADPVPSSVASVQEVTQAEQGEPAPVPPIQEVVQPENKDELRQAQIMSAILSLDLDSPEHFSSQTGNPIIAAVRAAANDESIEVKEVNAAWKKLNEKKAN